MDHHRRRHTSLASLTNNAVDVALQEIPMRQSQPQQYQQQRLWAGYTAIGSLQGLQVQHQHQYFHTQAYHEMQAREKSFYDVPQAYRYRRQRSRGNNESHREGDGKHREKGFGKRNSSYTRAGKKRGGGGNSRGGYSNVHVHGHGRRRVRTSLTSSPSSPPQIPNASKSRTDEMRKTLEKQILSLTQMDLELTNLIENYEQKLGCAAFYPSEFLSNSNSYSNSYADTPFGDGSKNIKNNNFSPSSSLIDTEEDYMKICISLRQLIARWTSLRIESRHFVAHCLSLAKQQQQQQQQQPNRNLNSSPGDNALNYIILLECLRKQRHELINSAKEREKKLNEEASKRPSAGSLFFTWMGDKMSNLTSSFSTYNYGNHNGLANNNNNNNNNNNDNNNGPPLTLEDLSAHICSKYTTNVTHYDLVIRTFVSMYRHSLHRLSTIERKQQCDITHNSLQSIFSLMNQCSDQGNPNCRPQRLIYHHLMRSNKFYPTVSKALRSMDLLNSMIDKRKLGSDDIYWPNRNTYIHALLAFEKLTLNPSSPLEEKLKLLTHAESILDKMEKDETIFLHDKEKDEEKDHDIITVDENEDSYSDTNMLELSSPSSEPYQIILRMIVNFGYKEIPSCMDRIDSLMTRMIGEEAYVTLCTDEQADLPPKLLAEYKMLSKLVYLFSRSVDREYFKRSRVILDKIQTARENQGSAFIHNEYPDTGPYNAYIMGLLSQAIKHHTNKRSNERGENFESDIGGVAQKSEYPKRQLIEDAIHATKLLDVMFKDEASVPWKLPHTRLIRLWAICNTKESGEMGEEILSRMHIHATVASEKKDFDKHFFSCYEHVFECWAASARAGSRGVPKRVEQLINRMNAQLIFDIQQGEAGAEREKIQVYTSALKGCAQTSLDIDKQDAFRIASDIYNKIQEEKLVPMPFTFVALLQCCTFGQIDDRQMLSKRVFEHACAEGKVNKSVLHFLKKANFPLFDAYDQK
eukprot:CAMPEP_0203682902 /NCGR_PEP_ID=MMETSP0090-20130426/47239_1 /ASSEMBLY_ACC=CAM_ASM_001088 /TAXON_ID=426623 /ORGANISM="Chaetoceros affinis, Strain CCMP159" /LENGTH=974 /DNA_ID=CAMNT_0050552019 /DNA_START=109 /DNA_END=3033 /DNA_ORIENTATION=-